MLGGSTLGAGALGAVGEGSSTETAADRATLPLRIAVGDGRATVALPMQITVADAATVALPMHVLIAAAAASLPPAAGATQRWRLGVRIGGIDMSARVTGEVSIVAEEGAARTAELSIVAPAGALSIPAYVGKAVLLDLALLDAAGAVESSARLFTGVVDVPRIDVATRVLSLTCTDQLQEVIAVAPRAWVDLYVAGRWSKAVFGEPGDTWQYALDQLSTVPASLDLDAYRSPRVTQWRAKSAPDVSLGAGDVVDGSVEVDLASRADIRSQVSGDFQYRFYRLRGRGIQAQFNIGSVRDVASKGLDMPSKAMIEQAVSGLSGWTLRGKIGWSEPPVGAWGGLAPTDPVLIITGAAAANLALGFSAFLSARWGQSITETTSITVRAAGEIAAAAGAREDLGTSTLDAEFDVARWEASDDVEPALSVPLIGDVALDAATDATCDRSASSAGVTTTIARARTRILATHRLTQVRAQTAIRPAIDLDKTLLVDAMGVRAQGKCSRVEHTLSIDTGTAVTSFAVAISGYGAAGIVPYSAPPDIPDPDPIDDETAEKVDVAAYGCECGLYIGQQTGSGNYSEDAMIGFTTNAKLGAMYDPLGPVYPLQFSMRAPDIEASSRDALELAAAIDQTIAIPTDLFEVSL